MAYYTRGKLVIHLPAILVILFDTGVGVVLRVVGFVAASFPSLLYPLLFADFPRLTNLLLALISSFSSVTTLGAMHATYS